MNFCPECGKVTIFGTQGLRGDPLCLKTRWRELQESAKANSILIGELFSGFGWSGDPQGDTVVSISRPFGFCRHGETPRTGVPGSNSGGFTLHSWGKPATGPSLVLPVGITPFFIEGFLSIYAGGKHLVQTYRHQEPRKLLAWACRDRFTRGYRLSLASGLDDFLGRHMPGEDGWQALGLPLECLPKACFLDPVHPVVDLKLEGV